MELPLETAMQDYPELIVSLGSSQLLRFIDELNGLDDINGKVKNIQKHIREEKEKPRSRETRSMIKNLYKSLYELQFQKDYICVVMDSKNDYDRVNQGFKVNGVEYKRFLGTNGGIKKSTIVYVNAELYNELKKRLDNGRNKEIPLVPAKLEAYQALICSGSVPIPEPKGIIVVNDCITHFKEDVWLINDDTDDEPSLEMVKQYDIEHNDSDGYGLMLPSYASKVNQYLNDNDKPLAGMNTRLSFEKGMLYTFDFVEFAETIAHNYEVTDVWGCKRDVREAEVILTESMLKLWQCYDSWEDYYKNCKENHYQFATPKTTPDKLENVRTTNYQFLQDYEFTDVELQELCQPTIDEITDVLGGDYRKALVFLAGFGLNDDNVFNKNVDYCTKALMANHNMINDPFIRKKIKNMISKRMDLAKKGSIKVNANYAMISGDPYALCQSMFGLEVTGLLKKGEVYHKHWIDKGADKIVCFRAPMTSMPNIRKMELCNNEKTTHWYKYIDTALIYNAWDSACEAMNGADKDGDTNMCTDNPVLLKNTLCSPTIICMQRKAEKKIVLENDIIQANKLAFNNDIGVVTNHVTSFIERRAGFKKNSDEYTTLQYRIMCGQHYQQATIDRAKGIIAKHMPPYWHSMRDCRIDKEDNKQTIKLKKFNQKIVAANKPYFMTYVYPELKKKYNNYIKNNDYGVAMRFSTFGVKNIKELKEYTPKTLAMANYLENYEKHMPVGNNPCTVNKICKLYETAFANVKFTKDNTTFDYSIMKSDAVYSKKCYSRILGVYSEYRINLDKYMKNRRTEKSNSDIYYEERQKLIRIFKQKCEQICTNEDELCNIVLDICYKSERTKQFAWDVCGDVILKNILKNNGNVIEYPQKVNQKGEFEYGGEQFVMCKKGMMGYIDNIT